MGWKEKWEDFKESFRKHAEAEEEREREEERKTVHTHREEALHRVDNSTGSESLDD